jgi:hypothetical protein
LFHLFVRFCLGEHPFANPNGLINQSKLVLGKFDRIVTQEYDPELVDMCHNMLSVVCVKGEEEGGGDEKCKKHKQ